MTSGRQTGHHITQVFCSALPVAYTSAPARIWEPFARLVLSAAYEATLWAGLLNAARTGDARVYLTLLGGGAFGNDKVWISDAIAGALASFSRTRLDVRIVCFGVPPASIVRLQQS